MFGAIAGGIASALAGGAMSKLFGGGQKAASGGIQGDVLDRKSGSAGMPRPMSYAVFCLKKKNGARRAAHTLKGSAAIFAANAAASAAAELESVARGGDLSCAGAACEPRQAKRDRLPPRLA